MISSLDISFRYDDISADCWSNRTYVVLSVFSAPFSSRNLKAFFEIGRYGSQRSISDVIKQGIFGKDSIGLSGKV